MSVGHRRLRFVYLLILLRASTKYCSSMSIGEGLWAVSSYCKVEAEPQKQWWLPNTFTQPLGSLLWLYTSYCLATLCVSHICMLKINLYSTTHALLLHGRTLYMYPPQYPEIHSIEWEQALIFKWEIQSTLSKSSIIVTWDSLHHLRTSPHCHVKDQVGPIRVLHNSQLRNNPSYENKPSLSSERSSPA
jgi:hypothetical protein